MLALIAFIAALLQPSPAPALPAGVRIDDSEARAVLTILVKEQQHQPVSAADWNALFSTSGYVRLRKREATFKRAFSDDDFKQFVSSPELIAKTSVLTQTLARWTSADITQIEQRSLAYLPAGSAIRATIYPLIKPKTNSFVFELDTNPAIMLYLDPAVTKEQFENTVAHELFHAGDAQNCPSPAVAAQEKSLTQPQKDVLEWLSAFGEGSAVLAAAGGPDVHPHAEDPQADREIWDKAMANFDSDFQSLQQFFLEIAGSKLTGDALSARGFSYFGEVQGPWYTVGYKMDVTIERTLGRPALINALCDKRTYLSTYNTAAKRYNASHTPALPLWNDSLVNFF